MEEKKKGSLVALEVSDMARPVRLCYCKAFADLKSSKAVTVKFSTVKTVEDNKERDEEFITLRNLSACIYSLCKSYGVEIFLRPVNKFVESGEKEGEVFSEWKIERTSNPFNELDWDLKAPVNSLVKRESSAVTAKKAEEAKASAKEDAEKRTSERLVAKNPKIAEEQAKEDKELKYIPCLAGISKAAIDFGLKLSPARMSSFEEQVLKILVSELG